MMLKTKMKYLNTIEEQIQEFKKLKKFYNIK